MFKRIFQFLSPYADPFEKKVDDFFGHLTPISPIAKIRNKADELLQKDIIRVIVFCEYRFKKYKKLKRSYRRKCYANAELIKQDFLSFFMKNKEDLIGKLKYQKVPAELKKDEQFQFLFAIMQYLALGKRLEYQAGSAFEKLLRDPKKHKLIGDCNQVATLYIALFAQKYSIQDLKLKLVPGHVCLHYEGVDIETTTGHFAHYEDYENLVSVEEMIAINLLDIPDQVENQYRLSPKEFLEASKIAFLFSSNRDLAQKNLKTAYHNLAVTRLKTKNFTDAENFAKKTENKDLLNSTYTQAVFYYLEKKKFSTAKGYAQKSGNPELIKAVIHTRAINLLNRKKYGAARQKFGQIHDSQGKKMCDQNELYDLWEDIRKYKHFKDYQRNRSKMKKARDLAKKVQEKGIVDFCEEVLQKV